MSKDKKVKPAFTEFDLIDKDRRKMQFEDELELDYQNYLKDMKKKSQDNNKKDE